MIYLFQPLLLVRFFLCFAITGKEALNIFAQVFLWTSIKISFRRRPKVYNCWIIQEWESPALLDFARLLPRVIIPVFTLCPYFHQHFILVGGFFFSWLNKCEMTSILSREDPRFS